MLSATPLADVQRTLTSLQSFFEKHAFDTEGPYADLFAVLLSTSKHLIDVSRAQQTRMDALERELRKVQQESAALCEQSAKVKSELHHLRGDLAGAEQKPSHRVAADCGWAAHNRSTRDGPPQGDGGLIDGDEGLHNFVRSVMRKSQAQGELETDLALRVHRLTEQVSRLSEGHHATERRIDQLCRQSQQPRGGNTASSPLRPLEALSEVMDMQREDYYQILQRRLADVEEGQSALADRLRGMIGAAEAAKLGSAEEHRGVKHALERTQEQLNELVNVMEEFQQWRRRQTPPRLPAAPGGGPRIAVLDASAERRLSHGGQDPLALTEEDFFMPSTATTRVNQGDPPQPRPRPQGRWDPREQQTENGDAVADRIWADWLHILGAVRESTPGSGAVPVFPASHPSAPTVARELHGLLHQSTLAPPSANADALADSLDTLRGRVEVLEVYAPHTYSIATRPPLLGVELADETHEHGEGSAKLRVVNVFTGLLADEAGISPGDVLLAVDNTVISTRAELYVALREKTRNHQVRCQLLLEEAFLSSTSRRAASDENLPERSSVGVQSRLPKMRVSLTVQRRDEEREVVVAVPASACWCQPPP